MASSSPAFRHHRVSIGDGFPQPYTRTFSVFIHENYTCRFKGFLQRQKIVGVGRPSPFLKVHDCIS